MPEWAEILIALEAWCIMVLSGLLYISCLENKRRRRELKREQVESLSWQQQYQQACFKLDQAQRELDKYLRLHQSPPVPSQSLTEEQVMATWAVWTTTTTSNPPPVINREGRAINRTKRWKKAGEK